MGTLDTEGRLRPESQRLALLQERCLPGDATLLAYCLLPVLPFGLLSYAWGMANVPARPYAIATLLGMTPPTWARALLPRRLGHWS